MQHKFDVVIIGGGLGGLTAGATLAKKGKKVCLLEQHYVPGGCATTFKRKDYVMEVGLHEIDGLFDKDGKQAIFNFLEVDKHIEFLQAPELFRYKSPTTDFVHPHGSAQTVTALIERFPAEEKGIRRYVKLLDAVLTEISRLPAERWKQRLLFPLMPLLFRTIVATSRMTLGAWLDQQFDSDELKLILQGNLVYYHDDPYSLSLFFFCAAQASYIGGGGHFVRGGSQQLSNYLARVIEEHGGQVLLGKKATRILIDRGRATGAAFEDSFNASLGEQQVHADRIIANAAIPLVTALLPDREAGKLCRKISRYETACSLTSIYIGFKRSPKSLGCQHYSTIVVGDDVESLADIEANCHASWEDRNFIFVDYSQLDAGLAPEGKGVGITPILPLLRELRKAERGRAVYLFYSNRTERVATYHRQLQQLDMPGFVYLPVFTATQGRIDAPLLETVLDSFTAYDYYLVGNHGFLQSMRELLLDRQVARARIVVDDFG